MGSSSSSKTIIMRLIIFTLSALLAFAVAEREFNLCAREEKVCPGGVKPKTPCADGSQPRGPSGRTDTCKPKWKRCADRCEAVSDWETPLPVDHQEQEPPMGQIDIFLSWEIFDEPVSTSGKIDISAFHHKLYAHRLFWRILANN